MGSKAIHTESDRAFCQSLKRVWPEGSVYTSHQLRETWADPGTAAVSQEALCVPKGRSFHWVSCKRSKLYFKTVWPALLPSCQVNFLLRTPYHSCCGWGRAGSLHSEFWDVAILLRDPTPLSQLILYSPASGKNHSEHGTSVMPGSPESKPPGEMEYTPFPTEGNASVCVTRSSHWHRALLALPWS